MKYMSEFRDSQAASAFARQIGKLSAGKEIRIMEVCGGHTITIYKYGIKRPAAGKYSSDQRSRMSGMRDIQPFHRPCRCSCQAAGCYCRKLRRPDPGSRFIFKPADGKIRRKGCPDSAIPPWMPLTLRVRNPQSRLFFWGSVLKPPRRPWRLPPNMQRQTHISNFHILSAHKTMPKALKALVENREVKIDAFICPGHVSAITGTRYL